MRHSRYAWLWLVLGAFLVPLSAISAAVSTSDCTSGQSAQQGGSIKGSVAAACSSAGWDGPPAMVPQIGSGQRGAVAGGSTSNVRTTVQAPPMPPVVAGAHPSVSPSACSFSFNFDLKLGSTSKASAGARCGGVSAWINGSLGGTNGNPTTPATPVTATASTSTCPVRDDTKGEYGALDLFPTNAPVNKTLACGGVVPLTNYRISLVQNPTSLFTTEYNTSQIWGYRLSGSQYTAVTNQALPTSLCSKCKKNILGQKTCTEATHSGFFTLAPQAQMITVNASAKYIALRLVQENADANNNPFATDSTLEYYLRLPVVNGVVQVPKGYTKATTLNPLPDNSKCGLESDYYLQLKDIKSQIQSGDIIIESSLIPGCELDATTCAAAGESQTPSSPDTCEVSTIYPSGTACTNLQQYMVLDRPNLLFPASGTVTATPVVGRTASMVSTTTGTTELARLVGDSNMLVRLNQSLNTFTFTNGGTMGMANNQRLRMQGPITVNMAALSVTLTNGGELDDAGGAAVTIYPANSVVSISAASLPVTLQVNREVVMPSGYSILSQPGGLIREPLSVPQ